MADNNQMALMLFMAPVGYQTAAWRAPTSRVEDLYGLELPQYMAQRAEEARLHAVFLADWLSFDGTGRNPDLTGYEPFTLMGALSAVTSRIGIVGTASTTFLEPYHLARMFSQLDFLSNGRVGWNIVTSSTGEENFTVELPPRDERYVRANEYLQVATGLWDAWRDDAVITDREAGVWADPARIKPLGFRGDHYAVEGPLLVPRSPQGWPVLVQAGASDAGKDFASRYGEVVFTVTATLDLAQNFYGDLKQRTVARGREASSLKILPGLMPIIGDTEQQALEIQEELANYIDFDRWFPRVSSLLHDADLSGVGLDETIPPERLTPPELATSAQDASSRYPFFYHLAVTEKYTMRQMIKEANKSSGHGFIAGTAEQVADHMESWFRQDAADGFALLPPYVPVGMDRIFDELVPELQRRGLFRTEYEGQTLRENLGFERPAGRTD